MEPLTFSPYLRPQVWGGRRLGTKFGKSLPPTGTFGESWEISCHPLHHSVVDAGEYAGQTLVHLLEQMPHEIMGPGFSPADAFPLLVKILDCDLLLSVQVHPTDLGAKALVGEPRGKTEAWIILDTTPGGRVYAGFKPGTTKAEVEKKLDAGTLPDCLARFSPQVGDCLFVPAGLVHAVGGGVVMAEVQQSSDATFRLYDWNRVDPATGKPRTLHREQAMASLDVELQPVWVTADKGAMTNLEIKTSPSVSGYRLITCPYFLLDRFTLDGTSSTPPFLPSPANEMSIWLILAGHAVLESSDFYQVFGPGSTVLIPASNAGATWRPAYRDEAPNRNEVLPTLLCTTIPRPPANIS